VSPYRQLAVLNLASGSVVNCVNICTRVWAATTTSDRRHDIELLC